MSAKCKKKTQRQMQCKCKKQKVQSPYECGWDSSRAFLNGDEMEMEKQTMRVRSLIQSAPLNGLVCSLNVRFAFKRNV